MTSDESNVGYFYTKIPYDRREDEVTVQEIGKVRFERIDVDVGGF